MKILMAFFLQLYLFSLFFMVRGLEESACTLLAIDDRLCRKICTSDETYALQCSDICTICLKNEMTGGSFENSVLNQECMDLALDRRACHDKCISNKETVKKCPTVCLICTTKLEKPSASIGSYAQSISENPAPPTVKQVECIDNLDNCTSSKKYCGSSFYNRNCMKTCNYCHMAKALSKQLRPAREHCQLLKTSLEACRLICKKELYVGDICQEECSACSEEPTSTHPPTKPSPVTTPTTTSPTTSTTTTTTASTTTQPPTKPSSKATASLYGQSTTKYLSTNLATQTVPNNACVDESDMCPQYEDRCGLEYYNDRCKKTCRQCKEPQPMSPIVITDPPPTQAEESTIKKDER